MPKRRAAILVALLLVLPTALQAADTPRSPGRPNILLILADDLGDRSPSCFGGTVPTPNLDRLAREGMVFRNAHAASMCALTRDEMFTGLSRAGRDRPDAHTPFFSNHLKALGYTNGMAGKWFVGSVFKMLGRLVDELNQLQLREQTLVRFLSDNGNSALDPLPEGALPTGLPCNGRSFAVPLLGRKGSPREWFIGSGAHPSVWLERVAAELGQPDLKEHPLVWIRGLRYRLYNDGRFYDLQTDVAEDHRIPPGSGSPEAEVVRMKFQTLLDERLLPPKKLQ